MCHATICPPLNVQLCKPCAPASIVSKTVTFRNSRLCSASTTPGELERRYTLHMKRTNLVLREELLEEAVRLSGERTYSRTVERALEDFVRRIKAGRILELAGSGAWEGDLAAMRDDLPGRSLRGRRRASR